MDVNDERESDAFDRGDPSRRSDTRQLVVDKARLPHVFVEDGTATDADVEKERRSLIINGHNEREAKEVPPVDRYNLVYGIMLLHGIGVLMPWNMFITATDYFVNYKLGGNESQYGKNFLSYLGICSQMPNLLLNMVNMVVEVKGSLSKRIVSSLLVVAAICLVTVVLAIIDSSGWPEGFFFLTMGTVIILNGANGIYQNSIYGLAADFPPHFSNAIVVGNNLCGTFISLVNILAIWAAPSQRLAAIYYFIAALLTIFACFDSYFVLPYCKFYRYYQERGMATRQQEAAEQSKKRNRRDESSCLQSIKSKLRPFGEVFKLAWVQMFNVFFVFFVTLTIFPAMLAGVEPYDHGTPISPKYFTPITTFLFFNIFAFFGSLGAHFFQVPGPRRLWIPVLVRGLMIPYFMFCNYKPRFRTWDVYITSDLAYTGMVILMSLSSGYLSSLAMMYAPRVVEGSKSRTAGMMAAFFLICGICGGVYFTLVIVFINESLGPNTPIYQNKTALN
uniref:Equilibrative nucleoside transporter 1 n=1 Tax=Plectus sambesii TaxID=2011161 RepID=A0A914WLP1_9BILA